MECLCFRTRMLTAAERSRSICTRCDLQPVNFGASKPDRKIPCTWTCGMTTLNQPNPIRESQNLAALPQLPRDAGEPVFAEPWQAQAFALAVRLSEQGHFTWKEWTDTLAAEIAGAKGDDGTKYYEWWLAALEEIVKAKGLLDQDTLMARQDAGADEFRHPAP